VSGFGTIGHELQGIQVGMRRKSTTVCLADCVSGISFSNFSAAGASGETMPRFFGVAFRAATWMKWLLAGQMNILRVEVKTLNL
jgi:hypothetical protein